MLLYYTLNPVLLSILCLCSCICNGQKGNDIMMGMEERGGEELFLSHPDPVVLELNKLHNQLKEKDRELGAAQNEIKALRATEVLKDKAIEQLTYEFHKINEKLRFTEKLLDKKNLEIKKLIMKKKEASAAQFAAEATLRRVHANQKDDNPIPIESIIAPLEANIKMYKTEIVALQEDKKALERHTKSKETALLEKEEILRSALERALIVEDVQNHNFELKRQIEICQEENRTLEKITRQKVLEVEKLSETIKELEEVILDGAAPANAVRDYQRQIHELNEEKRTLERQLARVKVSVNRVATVVANEWKDENDKVMPVKQWLEERRLLQAEMQRLRDKLAISERTAKAEAQIKDKLKTRLKTLEEGLKNVSTLSISPNAFCSSLKNKKSTHIFGFLSTNTGLKKTSTSQRRASATRENSPLQKPSAEDETTNSPGELKEVNSLRKEYCSGENLLRKSLWTSRSKVADSGEKENKEMNENSIMNVDRFKDNDTAFSGDVKTKNMGNEELQDKESNNHDMVSGFLYDRLQKEVIALRRFCEVKDGTLNAKDGEIKTLVKKVDTLTRAIEVESKKMKREAATRKKEPISIQMDDNKIRTVNSSKRSVRLSYSEGLGVLSQH